MDAERLARKVRWEGGLIEALEYGIRGGDIEDAEIAALWDRMVAAYDVLSPLLVEVAEKLGVEP